MQTVHPPSKQRLACFCFASMASTSDVQIASSPDFDPSTPALRFASVIFIVRTCNSQGSCDANGNCACNTGYDGPNCQYCAVDYYAYPVSLCVAGSPCGTFVIPALTPDEWSVLFPCQGCVCSLREFTSLSLLLWRQACVYCSPATTCSGNGICSSTGNCAFAACNHMR